MEHPTRIIANWKMQLTLAKSVELATALRDQSTQHQIKSSVEIVLCPSFEALASVAEIVRTTTIRLGGQDVFWQERGAYTGEISASMLKAVGCSYVILGHSERRKYLGETDSIVNQKIKAALAEGLLPILCVGETYEERTAGNTDYVIMRQVIEGLKGILLKPEDAIIIAYEPVWVIGTGQAVDPALAANAAHIIRQALIDLYDMTVVDSQCHIIYGGSVDEKNIMNYISLPLIEGALVGTTSLSADSFFKLIQKI